MTIDHLRRAIDEIPEPCAGGAWLEIMAWGKKKVLRRVCPSCGHDPTECTRVACRPKKQ